MKRLKNNLIPAAAIALGLLAATAGILTARHNAPQAPQAATQPPAPFQYLIQTSEPGQVLALFALENDGWQKIRDFPLVYDDLPGVDQLLLRRGVALRNAEELQRALEDYLPNS